MLTAHSEPDSEEKAGCALWALPIVVVFVLEFLILIGLIASDSANPPNVFQTVSEWLFYAAMFLVLLFSFVGPSHDSKRRVRDGVIRLGIAIVVIFGAQFVLLAENIVRRVLG